MSELQNVIVTSEEYSTRFIDTMLDHGLTYYRADADCYLYVQTALDLNELRSPEEDAEVAIAEYYYESSDMAA